MFNIFHRTSNYTPVEDFETKLQNRNQLISILKELSKAKTWEGVNKRNARGLFEAYAIKIEELFAETYYKDK